MSFQEFRTNLLTKYKSAGVFDALKAQLRGRFVADIQAADAKARPKHDRAGQIVPAGPDHAASVDPQRHPLLTKQFSLHDRVICSAILDYLQQRRFTYSLPVFSAEAQLSDTEAMDASSMISHLQLYRDSRMHQTLEQELKLCPGAIGSFDDDDAAGGANGDGVDEGRRPQSPPFLVALLRAAARVGSVVRVSGGTQTATDGVDERLERVHARYLSQAAEENSRPARSVEERMLAYQRECDARCAEEVAREVARLKRNEIDQMRLEERAEHRRTEAGLRQELQREYVCLAASAPASGITVRCSRVNTTLVRRLRRAPMRGVVLV